MWNDLHDGFRAPKPNQDELKKKLEEWHGARDDRRRDHRAHLMSRWGNALRKPDVTAELRVHAGRLARLARMEEIVGTEKTGDERTKLLEKIDKIRKSENERHERAMERIASAGAPAPSGIASAPAVPASAAPAPSAGGAQ